MGVKPGYSSSIPAASDFTNNLRHIQEEAKAAFSLAADNMAKYYNRQHEHSPKYNVGDQVWLNLEDYGSAHPSKKLDQSLQDC